MLSNLFPKKRAYLDWAAAAPVAPAAQRAYERALADFGNPSSPHTEGRAAKKILEDARTKIARELSMKADDVIFTSGATEANNIAILGHTHALMAQGRKPASIHVLYLPSAHASITETMRALKHLGVRTEALTITDGAIDIEALTASLKPETALVSTEYVCGETGTIWNTREVKQALPGTVLLHVDATQAPFEESLERTRLGADLLVLDAQKIGGVRGLGILAASRSTRLSALSYGGGQERALRSGTQLHASASAFATALIEARAGRAAFKARAAAARAELIRQISSAISSVQIQQSKNQTQRILNLSLIGRDTDYLVALLDEAGFAVSTKSACETDSLAGSRAVLSITGDEERAKSTLRISWGPATSTEELRRFAPALIRAVAFLDGRPA